VADAEQRGDDAAREHEPQQLAGARFHIRRSAGDKEHGQRTRVEQRPVPVAEAVERDACSRVPSAARGEAMPIFRTRPQGRFERADDAAAEGSR